MFAEVGIKTSDFDGERGFFEGDDTHASFVALDLGMQRSRGKNHRKKQLSMILEIQFA